MAQTQIIQVNEKSTTKMNYSKMLLLTLIAAMLLALSKPVDAGHNDSESELRNKLYGVQQSEQVMFGHQFDTYEGRDGSYLDYKSDTKEIVGDYPAIIGWNLSTLHRAWRSRKKRKSQWWKMLWQIRRDYRRGCIMSIDWQMPKHDEVGAWTLNQALQSNSAYKRLVQHELRHVLKSLTNADGRPIAFIFRPFHEMNLPNFWYADVGNGNTPQKFRQLWKWTVDYLRHQGVPMLLAYAPSVGAMEEYDTAEYLKYWPGDGYVDIAAFDYYDTGNRDHERLRKAVMVTYNSAQQRGGKLVGWAECGFKKKVGGKMRFSLHWSEQQKWWETEVLNAFQNQNLFNKVTYMKAWNNKDDSKSPGYPTYQVPYKNKPQSEGFKTFCRDWRTIFANDL